MLTHDSIFKIVSPSTEASMFVGYFRFEVEGTPRIGYFKLLDGHGFYSVWLFSSVQKVTDRDDPAYVVDKAQLRYVPEMMLDCFHTFAVDFNTPRWSVYVIHESFIVDESVVFRHSMSGIYSIENKSMVVDVVVPVDRGDFPLSTLDQVLTEGDCDHAVFGRSLSFLDVQHDLYQLRNMLAFHFAKALSGGKEKRSFRFDMTCQAVHVFELVML